jgi:hypothetical protein
MVPEGRGQDFKGLSSECQEQTTEVVTLRSAVVDTCFVFASFRIVISAGQCVVQTEVFCSFPVSLAKRRHGT